MQMNTYTHTTRLDKSNVLLAQLVKIGGETPEEGEGVLSSLLGGD